MMKEKKKDFRKLLTLPSPLPPPVRPVPASLTQPSPAQQRGKRSLMGVCQGGWVRLAGRA